MKINIYSVWDLKARSYGRLFLHNRHEEAIRSFTDGCTQKDSALNKHPEDFALHFLGTLDQETGYLEPVSPTPMHLSHATDHASKS